MADDNNVRGSTIDPAIERAFQEERDNFLRNRPAMPLATGLSQLGITQESPVHIPISITQSPVQDQNYRRQKWQFNGTVEQQEFLNVPSGVAEGSTSSVAFPAVYVNSFTQIWNPGLSFSTGLISITGLNTDITVTAGDYIYVNAVVSSLSITSASIVRSATKPATVVLDSSTPPNQTDLNIILAKIVNDSSSEFGIEIAGGLKIVQHQIGNMLCYNTTAVISGTVIPVIFPQDFCGAD